MSTANTPDSPKTPKSPDSPKTPDSPNAPSAPNTRRLLLDEAARVLAEEGPAALSARRLVKAVGASTMAVYTHFGSMPGLVREVMREGIGRFEARVGVVEEGDDPVRELVELCRVYQEFARAEPEVYAVMFGGSGTAGFELSEDDRQMGVRLLRYPRNAIRRCAAAGRFRADADADLLVRQLFVQMHGLARLAHAGYIIGVYGPDDVLAGALRDFAVAAGDDPERAAASVRSGLAG